MKWAQTGASACLALYLVSNLLVRSFSDIWLFIGWTSLCAGVILSSRSRGPRLLWWALFLLLGFHTLAIPGSVIWGIGNWELTAGVLLWMAPAIALYWSDNGERIFAWLIPVWLVHTGLIIWQGFTRWGIVGNVYVAGAAGEPTPLPSGLANNPNIAAGFLSLGIIYLLTTRYRWLAMPMLMALLFTGSRWGLLVTGAVLIAMVATRAIPWQPLAASAAVFLGAIVLLGQTPSGYAIAGIDSFAAVVHAVNVDVGNRLAVPHIPTFLPSGVAEHPGLHNVPLRIAVENGIAAATLWLGITLWALWPRRSNPSPYKRARQCPDTKSYIKENFRPVHRWLLLTLVLLSVLDYYTWMGHMGGFWWLLIGLLAKESYRPTSESTLPSPSSNGLSQLPIPLTSPLEPRTENAVDQSPAIILDSPEAGCEQ